MSAAEILPTLREPLAAVGFRKRQLGIYTIDLHQDVIGWLGLNTASRHHLAGTLEVNPVVGIRHQGVERIVATLLGDKFHPYVPPTLSSPVGYVMPESRYRSWNLTSNPDADTVASLVDAVSVYGLAFMRKLASLEALCSALEQDKGYYTQYRLPVARYMLGRTKTAQEGIDAYLTRIDGKTDPAALEFRSFANAYASGVLGGGLNQLRT